MGFEAWEALAAALDVQRSAVQAAFDGLFERREQPAHAFSQSLAAWLNDPQGTPDAEGLAEELVGAGIPQAAPVASRLIELTRSRRYRSLSEGGRAKMERLLPAAIGAAARSESPQAAALRLIDLLEAIDRREAYFSLLLEFPQVLDRAARLFARSAWAARLLARHPILLDELTRNARAYAATDWAEERVALAAECASMRGDVERLLDHLRHYKQRQVLRFVVADIEGELPVMALSDELSALADTILDATLAEVGASAGFPPEGIPGLAIVGYGKLGGKELGYGSDLDVIFVYDEALDAQRDKLARVAQRMITWLTSLTPAGVLYETDLRLRPDGSAGLLVSSLAAFREYQVKRAWTWEHQALTRARACAGDRALGGRFEALRDEILARPRDRPKLFEEVVAMRRKMHGEQKYPALDLKHMEGGVIDLEFCVQALVLAEGPAHPQLRENKGNHTLLKRAGDLGLIDRAVAIAAADAYLAMRRRVHQAALNDDESPVLGEGELEAERSAVRTLWGALFG
jgi:glutamate-ammonia-ligase adenylyltransferase